MKIRTFLTAVCTMLCALSLTAAAPEQVQPMPVDASELKLKLTTDKSPVSYKAGDTIKFTVSLKYGKQKNPPPTFFLQWVRSGDDGRKDAGMDVISEDKPLTLTTVLRKPGFVWLKGKLTDQFGRTFQYIDKTGMQIRLNFDGGAGVDIDKILPAAPEPADFEAFWKKQRARLDQVPLKPVLEPVDAKFIPKNYQGRFDVFAVTIPCADRIDRKNPTPVTGFLVMPKNAKEKSLAAQINFDGYGMGNQGAPPPDWQYKLADNGVISFRVNAHGYKLLQSDAYYKKISDELKDYAFSRTENDSPETAYFLGMALRVMRSFDFVKSMPQWNGKDLVSNGGSQGGLQAVWAAYLVPELTECKSSVTWCADMNGTAIGRTGGWRPAYQPAMGYFDAVSHARHIPKTCLLNITRAGLGDYVCPPSGLAALYNAATCPKRISWVQSSTHSFVPSEPEKTEFKAPASEEPPSFKYDKGPDTSEIPPSVKAQFDNKAWTLTVGDRITALPDFNGRANLRLGKGENGGDLPVLTKVILNGVLEAEADGNALVGVGADWWWDFSILNKKFLLADEWQHIFGRNVPWANNTMGSFDKTDWVFLVPVKKGKNPIRLDVTLGSKGMVAVGTVENRLPVSDELLKECQDFRERYPLPKQETKFTVTDNSVYHFNSVLPFPAGLEWQKAGDKKWNQVWCPALSTKHAVTLSGKPAKIRIAQFIYNDGWKIFRTKETAVGK